MHSQLVHENYIKCEKCTKMFSDDEKLLIHQQSEIHQGKLECTTCDKTFASLGSRRNHILLVHQNYVKCTLCMKILPNEELIIHKQSHVEKSVNHVKKGSNLLFI